MQIFTISAATGEVQPDNVDVSTELGKQGIDFNPAIQVGLFLVTVEGDAFHSGSNHTEGSLQHSRAHIPKWILPDSFSFLDKVYHQQLKHFRIEGRTFI